MIRSSRIAIDGDRTKRWIGKFEGWLAAKVQPGGGDEGKPHGAEGFGAGMPRQRAQRRQILGQQVRAFVFGKIG